MTMRSLRRAGARQLLILSWVLAALLPASARAGGVAIEGMTFEDSVVVEGTRLQLNGVGWRSRGHAKADVTGLYVSQKVHTLEALEASPGPKRLMMTMLQEISGSAASRLFLADFEAVATKDEFTSLINEVFQVGEIYSSLSKLRKGDVIAMDIVPGKGLAASLNGTAIVVPGSDSRYIHNDLLGRIFLRMFVGGRTPAELEANLLGQSTSMR